MNCPRCQHEAHGRFCENCGTPVPQVMPPGQLPDRTRDPNATSVLSAAELEAFAASRGQSQAAQPVQPQQSPSQPPSQPPYQQQQVYPQPQYQQQPPQAEYGAAPAPGPYAGTTPQDQYPPPQSQPFQYAPQSVAGQPGGPQAAAAVKGRPILKVLGGILVGVVLLSVAGIAAVALLGSHNSGKVKFGTSYKDNGGDFQIAGETTRFGFRDPIAWVAYLSDSVNPSTLTRTVALVIPGGASKTLLDVPVKITSASSSTVNRIATTASVADLESHGINPPGTYQVTYFSNGKKEATGTFSLTGNPVAGMVFFGTTMSNSLVTGETLHTSFGRYDRFDFVAHFIQPAGAKRLTVKFFFVTTDGTERQVSDNSVHDTVGDANTYVSKNQLTVVKLRNFGVRQRGIYILRYFNGSTQLAEGRFNISS